MMEKINKHFVLVHVHGNNWGEEFDYKGFKVPRVPEFTFVNKRCVTDYSPDTQDYPIVGIDFPNNPNKPECDLSFLKEMKCLKNLDLENNLVTKEKGYREAVWNLCPSLVVLDNHDREGQE
jgi:hypothetical protein